jgi:hypothetical protein
MRNELGLEPIDSMRTIVASFPSTQITLFISRRRTLSIFGKRKPNFS